MFPQLAYQDLPQLLPPTLGTRRPVFSFLADHHLPYIVPAVVFWIISMLKL